jgi:hypothetical protein
MVDFLPMQRRVNNGPERHCFDLSSAMSHKHTDSLAGPCSREPRIAIVLKAIFDHVIEAILSLNR